MALSQDRNTAMKDGELISVPVATGVQIYAGSMVVSNAAGYAAPGSTATGLVLLGRSDENVDNTAGANGAKPVLVRRNKSFLWKNSSSDPVTQANLGRPCYIEDDETVAGSDGAGTRSSGGIVLSIEPTGVWVES